MIDLDKFDRRILALLQENSRRTGAELSAEVGLSPAACLRRLQRLRDEGVIAREVALVAPEYRDKKVTVFVLLTFERDRPDREDHFSRRMREASEVVQCYHVTGSEDFLIAIEVADLEDYERFTKLHFYESYVKRFQTHVVLKDLMR